MRNSTCTPFIANVIVSCSRLSWVWAEYYFPSGWTPRHWGDRTCPWTLLRIQHNLLVFPDRDTNTLYQGNPGLTSTQVGLFKNKKHFVRSSKQIFIIIFFICRFSQKSSSHVVLLNRRLDKMRGRERIQVQNSGSKPLQSISDSISQSTLSQENTLQSLI